MRPQDATIDEWLEIIKGEYQEIPGLVLTRAQVQRLWGLEGALCDALLDMLVAGRFLRMTTNERYVRG